MFYNPIQNSVYQIVTQTISCMDFYSENLNNLGEVAYL